MSKNYPAFPALTYAEPKMQGMTLRDYFAAAAITGSMAGCPKCPDDETAMKLVAAIAYGVADAMLAERDK